jgi:hypothetical protein
MKRIWHKCEKGSSLFEAALGLPIFMILVATTLFLGWLMWTQGVASMSATYAVREAGMGRGNNAAAPSAGFSQYKFLTRTLGGGSAEVIGDPVVNVNKSWRMVRLFPTGSTTWSFGPLFGSYEFDGGGAYRIHKFYPGPPRPWE